MTGALTPDLLQQRFPPKQVHIIRVAYQEISEKGAHRVSLQQIADRAGVSKGVILYYFNTKDELLLRAMQWALSRTADRIHRSIATAASSRDQVLGMIDAIFTGAEANRRFYLTYLDLLDHAAREDSFGELSATFRSIVNSLYADVIRRGVDDGTFDVIDVAEASQTVRAIVDGLFLLWLQESDWRGFHSRYRETCRRAVLTYLRAD